MKAAISISSVFIMMKAIILKRRLVHFVNGRKTVTSEMCKLTGHGMPVTYEELEAEFPDCVLTRAHYANIF